jgi:FAD:protein FMN transferase
VKPLTATTKLAFVVAVVLLGLFFLGPGCGEQAPPALLKLSGQTMGTTWNATLVGPPATVDFQSAIQAAVEEVDRKMSTYREDSELSRFNRADAGESFRISILTLKVLGNALTLAEKSGGAFDPTILPLVEGWGFGAGDGVEQPSAEQIAEWQSQMGWQHLSIGERSPSSEVEAGTSPTLNSTTFPIEKTKAGLRVDLSANAKGFGVDHAATAIQSNGCSNFLIEVGGELRASGRKADGTAWRIGIDRPKDDLFAPRDLQQVLEVGNWSVATSGDYRNYREVDGKRISHLIDPRTGYPITHNLASVTVIAKDCMTADGLATAITILGVEQGLKLLEQYPQTHAYFILRDGDGFQVRESVGFQAFKVD